jgi:hypothetical protein
MTTANPRNCLQGERAKVAPAEAGSGLEIKAGNAALKRRTSTATASVEGIFLKS